MQKEAAGALPWLGAQVVGALSLCTKVAGSVPGRDAHKDQPMSASVSGTTN